MPIKSFAKDSTGKWFEESSNYSKSLSLYLNNLSPFSDIVVIQRRYLVKTRRFEISPSALLLFSNEFFINPGLGGHLSFYILEKHGLEMRGFYTAEFRRRVLIDMSEKLSITGNVIGDRTIYFVGLVYKWIPIYGKIAWFDNKIIPFEMSFFLGGGITRVRCSPEEVASNSPESELAGASGQLGECVTTKVENLRDGQKRLIREKSEPTVLFGLGQSYAISRNVAFRVDLNWQYYGALTGGASSFHHWDIIVTSGMSFYFPRRQVR